VKQKFKFISAGSTVATFLVILISIGFSYFVNNFARYNYFYGSIGAIIALQIFIYLNALALLLGFELNASIAISKNIRKRHPAQMLDEGNI
jgi:membrane protein